MEDILDADERPIKRGKLFSILNFICAIITPVLFFKIYLAYQSTIQAIELEPTKLQLSIKYTLISCLLGFVFMVISLVRKEKLKIIKPLGITLNMLWIFLLLIFIYYVLYL